METERAINDEEMTARDADEMALTPVEELEKRAFIAEHPEEFTDDDDSAKVWQSVAGRSTPGDMGPTNQPVPVNRIPEDDYYDTAKEAKE